ncbi:MAG: hypothetical protein ACLFTK_13540 [Anaerolineales bacterium]
MSDAEAKKASIRSTYSQVQHEVNLTGMLDTLTETTTAVAGLPNRIQQVRERGYPFANYLEGKAEMLQKQWDQIDEDARNLIRRKARDLNQELEEIEPEYDSLMVAEGAKVDSISERLEQRLARVEEEIKAAQQQIRASFGEVPNNVNQTDRHLQDIEGYLDLADEASFQLLAGEGIFMAVKAEWEKTGKDKQDPDGIFYITDKRIIMEQKEKVGKNFLGMGGEMQQEILWESPIGAVDEVAHENKGLMGGKDIIHIQFGSGGPFGDTSLEVKGGIKAEWFAAQLKRAATGGLEKERGLEIDEELVAAVANAPTICPVCGATFDQAIVAGMTQIKCMYCGAVTRLEL